MDQTRFHDLCLEASRLAVSTNGQIGNLILTQANAAGEPIIREPEMLHAFCRTLDEASWQLPYGIEVPTIGRYRFIDEIGVNTTTARHDLVLLRRNQEKFDRDVLIELKREQPPLVVTPNGIDCPAISKDFRKLLLEEAVSGKCMFHLCHAADRGTITGVMEKYNAGFTKAIGRVAADAAALGKNLDHNEGNWFALYILLVRNRNQSSQPFLLSYVAPTLADLVARTPVFHVDYFTSEPVLPV